METLEIDSIKSTFNSANQNNLKSSQRLNLVDITSTEQPLEAKQTLSNNQLSFSPEPKQRTAHFIGKNKMLAKGTAGVGCTAKTKIVIGLIGLFIVASGIITTVLIVKKGKGHNFENQNNENENNLNINDPNSDNTGSGNNANEQNELNDDSNDDDEVDSDLTDEEEQKVPDKENWDLHQITEKSVTTVDNDVLFTGKIGSVTHAIEVRMYYEGPGVRKLPTVKSGGLEAYPIYMNTTSFDKNYPELKESVTKEAKKLVTSNTSFDAINSQGQLVLNGKKKKRFLYKHVASIGNYLGDISNDEPAVIYQIYVNHQIE